MDYRKDPWNDYAAPQAKTDRNRAVTDTRTGSKHVSRHLLRRAARVSMVLVGLAVLATPAVATAATRPSGAKKLSADRVKRVGHVVCGRFYSSTQWVPGTRLRKGYFITHEKQSKNYARLARRAKGKRRKKLRATAQRYHRLARGQRSRCYFPASTGGPGPGTGGPATPLRFSVSGAVGLALGESVGAGAVRASSTRSAAATTASGSNLVAINGTGSMHDAVGSGSAAIQRFLIAPNDKVYVVFSMPVDLENTSPTAPWNPAAARCVIAVIDPASGVPSCVDSQLGHINTAMQQGANPPIQFDGAGAIYYTGYTTTGKTVLRRNLNGVTTDLINDNINVHNFLVRPDGSVFITGYSSTGASWTRRITSNGSLQNLRATSSTFMRAFPDGNVYMGLWNTGDFGVRRYLANENMIESKYWIGSNMDAGADSYFDTSSICSGSGALYAFCGMNGSAVKGTYATGDGKVFAIAGWGGEGVLMQYFPTVQVPTTAVRKISVGQSANTKLVLAGLNDQNENVLTLYDTSNGTEQQLIGPENQIEVYHLNYVANGNKVLFDGLRFADNKYVLGQVDLSTNKVTVSATAHGKWADFQTFG